MCLADLSFSTHFKKRISNADATAYQCNSPNALLLSYGSLWCILIIAKKCLHPIWRFFSIEGAVLLREMRELQILGLLSISPSPFYEAHDNLEMALKTHLSTCCCSFRIFLICKRERSHIPTASDKFFCDLWSELFSSIHIYVDVLFILGKFSFLIYYALPWF